MPTPVGPLRVTIARGASRGINLTVTSVDGTRPVGPPAMVQNGKVSIDLPGS